MDDAVEISPKTVTLALMTADVHLRMDASYQLGLEQIVFQAKNLKSGTDRKSQITAQNKLKTNTAKYVLTYVWRVSPCVPKQALIRSGYHDDLDVDELTSRGLAKVYCECAGVTGFDERSSVEQDVGRIVKAAHTYGLIEYISEPAKQNSKPFDGTRLLHSFMSEVNTRNAILINNLNKGAQSSWSQRRDVT